MSRSTWIYAETRRVLIITERRLVLPLTSRILPLCLETWDLYEPLVGDPCYRYNKCAKERFFKNRYLAFLFIQYAYYYGNEFVINKQWRVPPYQTLSDKHHQDHEGKITCLKAIFREFVILSLKTLKRCSI